MRWFALVLGVGSLLAQGAPVSGFEVAAIHRSLADEHARSHIVSGPDDGRFEAINVPLAALLKYAYALPETQVLNVPDWARTEKYDVEARSDVALDAHLKAMEAEPARAEKRRMLLALFGERFGLKWHEDTRDLPVYELVLAKGGSTLPEAKGGMTIDEYRGKYDGKGVSMAALCDELGKVTGRVVVDKTGLTGRYDVLLRWSPDDAADATVPGIFAAVQQQLGLKLVAAKAMVPVVVIDALTRPSVN